MDPSDISIIFTGFTGEVGSILVDNLLLILAILASLIGLGFLVMSVHKWFGGSSHYSQSFRKYKDGNLDF